MVVCWGWCVCTPCILQVHSCCERVDTLPSPQGMFVLACLPAQGMCSYGADLWSLSCDKL